MPMMRSNENNIIDSNNMGEKNKLLRELLSENTIEDLRTLVNFKRQMKKPKSTVKRMVDYLKQRAFKINIVNDRDPLLSCKKQGKRLVDFLSA